MVAWHYHGRLIVGGVNNSAVVYANLFLRLYFFDYVMLRLESIEPFSISEDETDIRDLIVTCYII